MKVYIRVPVEDWIKVEGDKIYIVIDNAKQIFTAYYYGGYFVNEDNDRRLHYITHVLVEKDLICFTQDELEEVFNETRLTHPMLGYKHKDFKEFMEFLASKGLTKNKE